MEANWITLIWLLPVCAIISWWLGRQSVRQNTNRSLRDVHPEYFQGLNYVLNEQPDKAIEVFIKMIEVDSETVETHLALGNLFRRRGEVDRAIRIHQNLIARPTLSREQRAIALLELGIDYMKSGLLDRAENLFNELIESGLHSMQAYRQLMDIYVQEKEWDNAIAIARRLEFSSGEKLNTMIAQFYCEKAEILLQDGQEKDARENLQKAINVASDCIRSSLIEARLNQDQGNFKQAVKFYRKVEKQDPEYVSEIIQPLHKCYQKLGRLDEYQEYLHELVERHGDINAVIALAAMIAKQDGEAAAEKFMITQMEKKPTVRGVDQLLKYALLQSGGVVRDSLNSINRFTTSLLKNRNTYKCHFCGFSAKTLHWQCPGCKKWNTSKPVQGLAGE